MTCAGSWSLCTQHRLPENCQTLRQVAPLQATCAGSWSLCPLQRWRRMCGVPQEWCRSCQTAPESPFWSLPARQACALRNSSWNRPQQCTERPGAASQRHACQTVWPDVYCNDRPQSLASLCQQGQKLPDCSHPAQAKAPASTHSMCKPSAASSFGVVLRPSGLQGLAKVRKHIQHVQASACASEQLPPARCANFLETLPCRAWPRCTSASSRRGDSGSCSRRWAARQTCWHSTSGWSRSICSMGGAPTRRWASGPLQQS